LFSLTDCQLHESSVMFKTEELKVFCILFAEFSYFPNIKWGDGEAIESWEGALKPSSSKSSNYISDSSGSSIERKLFCRLDFRVIFADLIKFNSLRNLREWKSWQKQKSLCKQSRLILQRTCESNLMGIKIICTLSKEFRSKKIHSKCPARI